MADKTDDLILSISSDTSPLKRALRILGQEIDSFSKDAIAKFDKAGAGIDKSMTTAMQQRIDQMVGIGTKASKEWSGALSQQGAELEKLRTKYNPIYAAIKQYQASVVSIQQANRLGAISADEMTSAIQRERRAALDSISAIKQRNNAVASGRNSGGPSRFNTANIAAQFQDIAVTSAMGMSPIQIALQQGTQLSAVFNEMGKGRDVIKGIGAAFASIVSPVSLVTIGVIAAGAALFQYISSGKKTKDLTELFQQHAESLSLVRQRYGELADGLLDFRPEGVATQIKVLRDELSEFYKAAGTEANRVASHGAGLLTDLAPSFKGFPETARQMRNAFADLNASIRQGKPDLLSFRDTMSKIANDTSVPKSVRDQAAAIAELDPAAVKAARAIPGVQNAIRMLGEAAAGEIQRVREFTAAMKELSGVGVPQLDERGIAEQQYKLASNRAPDRESKDDAYRAYQAALERIYDQERLSRIPTPGEKPNFESIAPTKTKKTDAERQAQRDANAYRDLVKSAQDRIDQLKLEEQLVGKTGVAAETMRMKLELLQKAQDKGRSVSEAQRAEIDKLATAYGKAAEKVSAMQMVEELQFERAQMFRSPTEQKVYGSLRSAGINPDSEYGQAIGNQIRLNEQLAIGRERALDFAQGLANDIMNSADAVDILRNSVSRLAQMLIEMGTNSAINGFFANFGGGLGGGSFTPTTTLGNFLKGIPGFAGGTDSAPPGFAWVGEKGPELVRFGGGEQVVPNDILRSMANRSVSGPRVPNVPSAANSASQTGVHVTLGWSSDSDGNIAPIIKSVAQREVKTGLTAFDKTGAMRTARDLRQVNSRGLAR
ncbi:phage tail length tape measure family protein [Ochrobactrum soli]|uniref:Bacteriophage tail tape measure N-terminal domain-containing protein n=1 Tax=Ochrobactrum soli TaxID=2448455 RepID=A0A849KQU2_9HYPH|nr:phage tail length tape measure family protein [[Ochrobactrum] soli]NNU59724.1 hypothetical protein [[Ochrobactrum] soli]